MNNREQNLFINNLKWQRIILLFANILFLFFSVFTFKKSISGKKIYSALHAQKETLYQLNQSKDQLFSIVAHDLRSAVYTLKINLSKLKTALLHNQVQKAIVLTESTELLSNSTHSLLNNLLYWSLSETGEINFKQEAFEIRAIIDQVCYDFIPIAASKTIALHNTLPKDIQLVGDINSIKIIFRNLIDNAIKYTPDFGNITISGIPSTREYEVTVKDTGIGMSQDVIDSIFQNENKRIQNDTNGNRSTGLGLWLSKNMSEKNNGKLSVKSIKGTGTEVAISLPLNLNI